jgi:hypothetical protein
LILEWRIGSELFVVSENAGTVDVFVLILSAQVAVKEEVFV